jgi:hypothetical protein
MAIFLKLRFILPVMLYACTPAFASEQPVPSAKLISQVQQKMIEYLNGLADLHCTEFVTQEKLSANGHVEVTERAKYDYLIMMQGGNDQFELNETRVLQPDNKASKPSPVSMLVSNGIATALLMFHPYYRDSYNFETGTEEITDGRALIPVYFQQIPGRRSPAALALRGREYPLELKGTAWIDPQSDEVMRIDAGLLNDMSDIGLRAMKIHVEYKVVPVGKTISAMDLPVSAVVDVTTPRQRWRNTHTFDAYKSFSIEAEQDPNVKVHEDKPDGTANDGSANSPSDTKEKQ